MLLFILRRLGVMVATMVCLTFVVFYLVNLEPNLKKLALEQNNNRMTEEAVESWLLKEGYRKPILERYAVWIGNAATGDFGTSTRFRKPVAEVLAPRIGYTGTLMFWVMITMVPSALIIGVLAGMREGSKTDRSLSVVAIASTATGLIESFGAEPAERTSISPRPSSRR